MKKFFLSGSIQHIERIEKISQVFATFSQNNQVFVINDCAILKLPNCFIVTSSKYLTIRIRKIKLELLDLLTIFLLF
jgi:hypothetical protein